MPNGTCTIDGCDRPQFARTWCSPHYSAWYRYGDPSAPIQRRVPRNATANERLVAHGWTEVLHREDLGACWEFNGAKTHGGYGWLQVDTNPEAAHRIAYRTWVAAFDSDLVIRHRCDNPPCINPSHLLPGTQADNVADKVERDRAGRKLNNAQRQAIIEAFDGSRGQQRLLAEQYGVSRARISQIIRLSKGVTDAGEGPLGGGSASV